MGMHEA
jgi:hypothetical protein